MPQDTTIHLNGKGVLTGRIDSLPIVQQQQVSATIYQQREEIEYSDATGTYIFFIFLALFFSIAAIYSNHKTKQPVKASPGADLSDELPLSIQPGMLVYTGNALKFDNELIVSVLTKRSTFYNSLSEADRLKFIKRLRKFISRKTFIIHDSSGFKEMPILISATAVQISFGLDKYLLPNFTTFNIYPVEFIGTYPFIRFLVGNVTGNTINLSWKHFLEGFQFPGDGQNVGMHELAHALYYQTFVAEKNVDRAFRSTFTGFNDLGSKAFEVEKENSVGLYTDYAIKDFQEFWAESVEIFFEKPVQLKCVYPDLYLVMSDLLNQDPAGVALQNFA